jgi:bifunctional DNA-binding transcriptional regulator/antitoxin component of YhaV-PrlF toxin-antitoxin module
MNRDEVTRASATLYNNGHSDHVTIPAPIRSLLQWGKREPLIMVIINDQTITVTSLEQHMKDIIAADRRARTPNGEASL